MPTECEHAPRLDITLSNIIVEALETHRQQFIRCVYMFLLRVRHTIRTSCDAPKGKLFFYRSRIDLNHRILETHQNRKQKAHIMPSIFGSRGGTALILRLTVHDIL